MKQNPLSNLAKFIVARKHDAKQKPELSSDKYRNLLLEIAAPLGNMFSDELDNIDDLFEMLEEEDILSKEAFCLLKHDKEFQEKFEEGIKLGQEEDDPWNEDYDCEEWEEDKPEGDEDYFYDEEYEDSDFESPRNPLAL